MTVRILVVDDHEVVRQGLRSILETQAHAGWTVCGEAGNGREAVDRAKELLPDVIVMDLSMPELNGLEATRQILAAQPGCSVLILSASETEDAVRDVLAAGARGYVLKSDASRELVAAVDSLGAGRPFFSAKVANFVLRGFMRGGAGAGTTMTSGPGRSALTSREREVLQLIAEGRSNKEVAVALDIGVKTAEAHRANLMRKLGVRSVGELVRYAVRNKIVEP